ncbi:SH3 domain-containing protein [Chelativorans intermedius]|uniref:SH3 domain-containing protein n=1 Tax=Chelativorans intermedius TaxID=515947 RepID=A0ABV6D9M7_9HYPH|nr:SH3 domain-containing protein [Chelativorans intermedius]MCT8999147.1 SH3 domain-containing protein [Chelativorans intermedius]
MPLLAMFRKFVPIAVLAALAAAALPAMAPSPAGAQQVERGPSGLPLPRFVSLKAGRVNMRVGPGTDYAVEWLYLREGLPMEVIQEYDSWRRVRDAEGAEGWIHSALLSGRRTGLVAPWLKDRQASVPLHARPDEGARRIAEVEPGALGQVESCDGTWCRMRFASLEGWMSQSLIWGVYPGETVED